jgi:hypothetical protein
MSKNMQVHNLLLRVISSLKIDYHPTGEALICHSCFIERELQSTCTFAETRSNAHKQNKQELFGRSYLPRCASIVIFSAKTIMLNMVQVDTRRVRDGEKNECGSTHIVRSCGFGCHRPKAIKLVG